jgi:hypothetical protein
VQGSATSTPLLPSKDWAVVYLIACDHDKAQTYRDGSELENPQNKTQREFRELLIRNIEKYTPVLIAEEHHSEILQKRKLHSVASDIAWERGIRHRFCEPSFSDKKRLGIEGLPDVPPWDRQGAMCGYFQREWPIREEFWIRRLGEDTQKSIFFICGAGHRETLRRRLERAGIKVRIIAKRFGAQRMPASDYMAYKVAYKDLRRNGFPPIP